MECCEGEEDVDPLLKLNQSKSCIEEEEEEEENERTNL